jgi:predicted metal-dependent hydrolase
MPEDPAASPLFGRGIELFDAGYYWEAHEAWEVLWHAAGRRGPTADVLRGLIKLAAAGIKVRERREPGVRTHARRAAECFASARREGGAHQLGLDLDVWIERALAIAEDPPTDPGPPDAPVTRVFGFRFDPVS